MHMPDLQAAAEELSSAEQGSKAVLVAIDGSTNQVYLAVAGIWFKVINTGQIMGSRGAIELERIGWITVEKDLFAEILEARAKVYPVGFE